MSKAKKKSTQRSANLKRIAKRLAAYSATAAATVMTQDRTAEAGEVVWDIPDITAGPAHGHWVVFNLVSGAYGTTATFAGHSTSGKIRLAGYYSGFPNPYIYTPASSTFGAFVTNPGGLYGSDALRLSAGVTVSGGLPFGANSMYFSTGNYANLGSWSVGDSGFVGIRFNLTGDPHFGWAEISRISSREVTLHAFGYNDAEGSPSVIPSGITGDFNGDGNYDHADVDPLVADVAGGGNTPSFDLNGDGSVDTVDLTSWLAEAGEANLGPGLSYLPGDADLSGVVDAGDLNSLGINWQQPVAAWSAGDFTANGIVDVQDLNVLGVNWQMSSLAAEVNAAVPEPSGIMLLAAGAAGLGLWRRKRAGKAG